MSAAVRRPRTDNSTDSPQSPAPPPQVKRKRYAAKQFCMRYLVTPHAQTDAMVEAALAAADPARRHGGGEGLWGTPTARLPWQQRAAPCSRPSAHPPGPVGAGLRGCRVTAFE